MNRPKFIRLKDENASIDQQFLMNLAKVMIDLRAEAYKRKIANRQKALNLEVLNENEVKKIKDDVSKIILAKLDDTKDFKGCLYSDEPK
jgi:hypothetical protein